MRLYRPDTERQIKAIYIRQLPQSLSSSPDACTVFLWFQRQRSGKSVGWDNKQIWILICVKTGASNVGWQRELQFPAQYSEDQRTHFGRYFMCQKVTVFNRHLVHCSCDNHHRKTILTKTLTSIISIFAKGVNNLNYFIFHILLLQDEKKQSPRIL